MLNELNHFLFLQINQFATKSSTLDLMAIQSAEYLQYFTILTFILLLLFGKKKMKFIALLSLYTFILARVINYTIQKIYYHPDLLWMNLVPIYLPTQPKLHSRQTILPSCSP